MQSHEGILLAEVSDIDLQTDLQIQLLKVFLAIQVHILNWSNALSTKYLSGLEQSRRRI